jgi:hypothetical protein
MRTKTGSQIAAVAVALALGLFVANWLTKSLVGPVSPYAEVWLDPEKPFREAQLKKLRSLKESAAAQIEFQIGDGRLAVSDAQAVQEFLELLTAGRNLHRHHSHPEKEVTFSLAGSPEIYQLGQDSAHPNEYWLQGQRQGERGPYYQTILQFQSEGLTAWLAQNHVANRPSEGK